MPRPGYSNSLMSGGYFPAGGLKSKKTHSFFLFFLFFHCRPNDNMAEVLVGPKPALRPLAQDLAQSPGSQLRLGLLAWAGAGTPGLWRLGCQAEAQARIQ